jgi:hypothetical protein
MRFPKSSFLIVAAILIVLCLTLEQPAQGYTHAIAVTIDEDDTPFVLDSTGAVWGYLQPDKLIEPERLPNLGHIKQIVPFAALTQDGHVFTWDRDGPACAPPLPQPNSADDSAGPEPRDLTYSAPHQVPGLNNIISISGDERHFLALRRDGKVLEFGEKLSIELAAGIRPGMIDPCAALPIADKMTTPKVIPPISGAIAIATSQIANKVLERNGFVYSWYGGQLDTVRDWHSVSEDWQSIQKTFIGTDKMSISLGAYLIALSRDGKAYYWGHCRSTLGGGKDLQMVGVADDIAGIKKIVSAAGGSSLNAYLLANGKMVLVLPPVPASANTDCSDQDIFSQSPPVFVSQMPTKVIDAAFPASDLAYSILMVGSDGTLWKINAVTYHGGLRDLTNINLP